MSQLFDITDHSPVHIVVTVGELEISLNLTDPHNNQTAALSVDVYHRDTGYHHGGIYASPAEVAGEDEWTCGTCGMIIAEDQQACTIDHPGIHEREDHQCVS